jgi:hypothetical protein
MKRMTSAAALALLTLLCTSCGPELVGGGEHGRVQTDMTDEPGQGEASTSRATAPAYSLGPTVFQQVVELGGSISADVAVALTTAAGGSVAVTPASASGTVGIGEGDRAQLGDEIVEVGVYPGVRFTFTRVEAALAAGAGLPLSIEVDLSGGPLVVELPVQVVVRDESEDVFTALDLDLNGAVWLVLADPATGLVGREAFAAAVRATAVVVEE